MNKKTIKELWQGIPVHLRWYKSTNKKKAMKQLKKMALQCTTKGY